MHLILFLISVTFAREWPEVLDQHLTWSEEQQYCKALMRQFDSQQPLEALKCLMNHPRVKEEPKLETGMIHCTKLIARFKPEYWATMNHEFQSELIHCIVGRILTHELSHDFTSSQGTFGGHNAIIWRKQDL